MKAPWNEVYVYDVSENQIEETMDVLDKSGLSINDVTADFIPYMIHREIRNFSKRLYKKTSYSK